METPCNGNPLPCNGNPPTLNGNPLPFIENFFGKQGMFE
jgi:hypothetical protein